MSQNELHVVFGTGALGKWTARELVRLGRQVRMVNHSGKTDSRYPPKLKLFRAMLYDTKHNIEVTAGCGGGVSMRPTAIFEWAEKFPPLQKSILDGVQPMVQNLSSVDNLYMYGGYKWTSPCREDYALPRPHQKRKSHAAKWQLPLMHAHRAGKAPRCNSGAPQLFWSAMTMP